MKKEYKDVQNLNVVVGKQNDAMMQQT